MVLSIVLGFFREDTRIIGLPPVFADAVGRPGWRPDVDRRGWGGASEDRLIGASRPPEKPSRVPADRRRGDGRARRGLLRKIGCWGPRGRFHRRDGTGLAGGSPLLGIVTVIIFLLPRS